MQLRHGFWQTFITRLRHVITVNPLLRASKKPEAYEQAHTPNPPVTQQPTHSLTTRHTDNTHLATQQPQQVLLENFSKEAIEQAVRDAVDDALRGKLVSDRVPIDLSGKKKRYNLVVNEYMHKLLASVANRQEMTVTSLVEEIITSHPLIQATHKMHVRKLRNKRLNASET